MLVRVQKTQQGLVIPVSAEMAVSLEITDGTEVNVVPVAAEAVTRCASAQQSLDSFQRTLPRHETAYRELAK